MKKILIGLIVALFITVSVQGQDEYFFLRENSYLRSESFALVGDIDNQIGVIFAKNGAKALFIITTPSNTELRFGGKTYIYLEDGTAISLVNPTNDYLDNSVIGAYYLTGDDVNKMKKSNIKMVRYRLEDEYGETSTYGGNFTASNSDEYKTDYPEVISKFFDQPVETVEYPESSAETPALDMSGWNWDRLPKPGDVSNEEGHIVFEIKIDDEGEIISIRTIEKSVSDPLVKIYRSEVAILTFSPTSDNVRPAPTSTGRITFIIKAR